MYIQSSVSVPQPEFIVVSYIVTSGIRAKKGDLPIIQRRLIVTSSDILYKLWIPCREGDQYLLYLHLQHNITSFICANEGESVVVYPNISSVILRDEPEMLCIIPYQSTFQWIPEIIKYSWGQTKSEYIDIKWNISIRISYQLYARSILCILNNIHRIFIHLTIHHILIFLCIVWRCPFAIIRRIQTSCVEGTNRGCAYIKMLTKIAIVCEWYKDGRWRIL